MPFSSLTDSRDLALAQAALEAVWDEIKPDVPPLNEERERTRLAYIIAGLAHAALDQENLKRAALERYRESV